MKKIYFILVPLIFCFVITNKVSGQKTNQNHEVGIRTSNLSSFSIIYKKNKGDNSFNRLRLATGEIDLNDIDPFNASLSLGIAGGSEKRKMLSENFFFVTGFELFGNMNVGVANEKLNFSVTPGIGAVLGFTYIINDNFLMGVESIPAASFNFRYANDEIRISDLSVRFITNYASLFVAYRFSK